MVLSIIVFMCGCLVIWQVVLSTHQWHLRLPEVIEAVFYLEGESAHQLQTVTDSNRQYYGCPR